MIDPSHANFEHYMPPDPTEVWICDACETRHPSRDEMLACECGGYA